MKVPFDIKCKPEIESGKIRLVTGGQELAVRIVCWDADKYWPIVGVCDGVARNYDNYGKCYNVGGSPLYMITEEKELSRFERQFSDYLKNDFEFFATKKWDESKWNEVMRIQSAELMSIAKSEIEKNQERPTLETSGIVKDVIRSGIDYSLGFQAGQEQAMNELPQWKPVGTKHIYGDFPFTICDAKDLVHHGYYIPLVELLKLPGFKEE